MIPEPTPEGISRQVLTSYRRDAEEVADIVLGSDNAQPREIQFTRLFDDRWGSDMLRILDGVPETDPHVRMAKGFSVYGLAWVLDRIEMENPWSGFLEGRGSGRRVRRSGGVLDLRGMSLVDSWTFHNYDTDFDPAVLVDEAEGEIRRQLGDSDSGVYDWRTARWAYRDHILDACSGIMAGYSRILEAAFVAGVGNIDDYDPWLDEPLKEIVARASMDSSRRPRVPRASSKAVSKASKPKTAKPKSKGARR